MNSQQKYDFFHMNLEAADVWALFLEHKRKLEVDQQIETEIAEMKIADMTI